jgi:hypothetical protein
LTSYRDLAKVRCRSTPPCPLFADAFLLAQQEERRQIIVEHRQNLAAAAAQGNPVFGFAFPANLDLRELARIMDQADAQLIAEREAGRVRHIFEMEQEEAKARRSSETNSTSVNMNSMDWVNDGCKFAWIATNDPLTSLPTSLLSLTQGARCLDQCILN